MIAELNIVSDFEQLPAEKCLEVICRGLRKRGIPHKDFTLYGESIDLAQASKVLGATKDATFLLEGKGWQFHRTAVRHHRIDTFAIKADLDVLDAEMWMSELSVAAPITQAWVVNAEYDYWQNAEDPLQYSSKGKAYEHLPKCSNGLPPPLEQTIVDISSNPGRRVLRMGHIEAVGSPMWFGLGFWRLTGIDNRRLLAERWTNCTEATGGLLRIQPSKEPFSSSEGGSATMQVRLRSVLYPEK